MKSDAKRTELMEEKKHQEDPSYREPAYQVFTAV